MFSFTLDIYCTSVRPGRGIPHMWLSLRFLLSFYLLKGFFSSFSLLLLRVKGRGCHTLLKPYETNCGLWIWAIQIKFDWLIDWLLHLHRVNSAVCCYSYILRRTTNWHYPEKAAVLPIKKQTCNRVCYPYLNSCTHKKKHYMIGVDIDVMHGSNIHKFIHELEITREKLQR